MRREGSFRADDPAGARSHRAVVDEMQRAGGAGKDVISGDDRRVGIDGAHLTADRRRWRGEGNIRGRVANSRR